MGLEHSLSYNSVAVVVVVVEGIKNVMASPAADVGRATKPAVCHTFAYEICPLGSGRRRSWFTNDLFLCLARVLASRLMKLLSNVNVQ